MLDDSRALIGGPGCDVGQSPNGFKPNLRELFFLTELQQEWDDAGIDDSLDRRNIFAGDYSSQPHDTEHHLEVVVRFDAGDQVIKHV